MKTKITPMGMRILMALNERGMMQKDLAREVGISEATLSYVIRGVKVKYGDVTVLKIMSWLGLSLADAPK